MGNKTHLSLNQYLKWDLATAARRVGAGLPATSMEALRSHLKLNKGEFAAVIQVSPRTMARREKEELLLPDESDRVYRLGRLLARATEVFGSEEAALAWFKAPNYALGDITPLGYATSDPGAELVERLLGRIDHGIPV